MRRWLVAGAVLLSVLDTRLAWPSAYIIRADEFRPSNKEYPECGGANRVPTPAGTIEFSGSAYFLAVVEIDERTHCIAYRSSKTGDTQAVTIENHRFVGIHVGDIILEDRLSLRVLFHSFPLRVVEVEIVRDQLVVRSRNPATDLPDSPDGNR